MKKPKLRELKEAFTSLFSPPYTTKFPFQPHIPAKRFRGKPQFNEDTCIGCGACAQVCPSQAIDLEDVIDGKTGKRTLLHDPGRCLFCGQCELNCPVGDGIKMSKEFDVSSFDIKKVCHSVSHELVICRICGEVIGPVKQLMWIAKKLGPMALSNAALITQIQQRRLEITAEIEEKVVGPVQRTDSLKVICPKCRRKAFLSDEKIGN